MTPREIKLFDLCEAVIDDLYKLKSESIGEAKKQLANNIRIYNKTLSELFLAGSDLNRGYKNE